MAYLILVRHGMSEYNAKGLWTGWDDPELTEEGREQARQAGEALKDIRLDFAYTSVLKRAIQTLDEIKKALHKDIPTTKDKAINERNYGDFTKKNKWQVKEEVGEEEFQNIRRGWDHPIKNGESLKNVYDRSVPYFQSEILPKLKAGKNVIIVSSGNSLRALAKYLEHISDDDIAKMEIGIGEVLVYTIDENGKILSKEVKVANLQAGKQ